MEPRLKAVKHAADQAAIQAGGRWAPTSNMTAAAQVLERALNRASNLPGLCAFYGPSGWGKSMASAYCANKFGGVYVECRSFFTSKTLLLAIVRELGLRPGRTQAELLDQIAEQLLLSRKPLIIDEMDHIVEGKAIETVRDIFEASQGTVMLIGEELFPRKLQRWERFHNRVLIWEPAKPCSLSDARQLARFYAPKVDIGEDLLAQIIQAAKGATRRVCVNIELVREAATTEQPDAVDLAWWGKRELYTGEAPVRRI
jgi:DNA transposition AAA+ family ATPase